MSALSTAAAKAHAELLAAIEDSRRVYAGDVLLDLAEETTGDELLRHCERTSRDEYASALMAQLVSELKAHAASKVSP